MAKHVFSLQHAIAALYRGLGWKWDDISKEIGLSSMHLKRDVASKQEFKDLVETVRNEFFERLKDRAIEETVNTKAFLEKTMEKVMKTSHPKWSDGVQAAKEINRMEGQLAPKELKKTIEYREAEKLTDEELTKELNEFFKSNEGRKVEAIRREDTGEEQKREGKVQE